MDTGSMVRIPRLFRSEVLGVSAPQGQDLIAWGTCGLMFGYWEG